MVLEVFFSPGHAYKTNDNTIVDFANERRKLEKFLFGCFQCEKIDDHLETSYRNLSDNNIKHLIP